MKYDLLLSSLRFFSGMDAVIKFLEMFEDNYPETLKIAFVINGKSSNTMFMG